MIYDTSTSLTFLFGITTFVADELLAETLRLEAAPTEEAMPTKQELSSEVI